MSTKDIATVCSPIRTLDDLLNVSEVCLTNRFQTSQLIPRHTSPKHKILLCHDMKGGYLEDKHTQGCQINEPCYRFFRWHLIDIFVYFAHELVTIPPVVWIDCAHQNGVQILGTFITEFDTGKEICKQLFASDDSVNRVVDALALLMAWYRFDGYLLNIENPVEPEHIPRLLYFISRLKSACSKIDPTSLVIWYDSVTIDGELKWQNRLNDLNKPYFDICDGIFLNYTWKPEMLLESRYNAGERYRDVFVGIDVFGRGCLGGGGFKTSEAIYVSHQYDLSAALFAPGWLFETLDAKMFIENDKKFWGILEPYMNEGILHMKGLTTFFSDGCGEKFYIHGSKFSSNAWYNLSLQSYFPNVHGQNTWTLDHQDAYFGGSCIELIGNVKRQIKLFKCLIPIESVCEVIIAFKNSNDVRIELELDNGTKIHLNKSENEVIVRHWRRKTYRYTVNERASITSVSIQCNETAIKLGYLSVRPLKTTSIKTDLFPPLIQSIEHDSNSSIILHFVNSIQEQDASSILLIFARNQLEQYLFLGATRQSYFVIFNSDLDKTKQDDSSVIVIRHYSLDSLELLNEQIVSIPIAFDCLRGFIAEK